MDINIFGLREALEYLPTTTTYAIRIQGATLRHNFSLQNSDLYTIVEYTFDDDHPHLVGKISPNSITFNEEIADKILRDFKEKGRDKETLLVHCSLGKNRSPAVGIALNEIFTLGQDTKQLKKRFNETNWYIYDLLIQSGKKYNS